MNNNTDPQNPEAGRAPSQSEQLLPIHVDTTPVVSQQASTALPVMRRYEVTLHRNDYLHMVVEVKALNDADAINFAYEVADCIKREHWTHVDTEIDAASIEEVGGSNE